MTTAFDPQRTSRDQEHLDRLRRQSSERRAAFERRAATESITLEEASALTGAPVEKLQALVRLGLALFVQTDRGLRLPSWQFRADPVDPVMPEVLDVAGSFPGDVAILHDWMLNPNVDLGGSTPAEALVRGDGNDVSTLASAIGAAGR